MDGGKDDDGDEGGKDGRDVMDGEPFEGFEGRTVKRPLAMSIRRLTNYVRSCQ